MTKARLKYIIINHYNTLTAAKSLDFWMFTWDGRLWQTDMNVCPVRSALPQSKCKRICLILSLFLVELGILGVYGHDLNLTLASMEFRKVKRQAWAHDKEYEGKHKETCSGIRCQMQLKASAAQPNTLPLALCSKSTTEAWQSTCSKRAKRWKMLAFCW